MEVKSLVLQRKCQGDRKLKFSGYVLLRNILLQDGLEQMGQGRQGLNRLRNSSDLL